jgi:hypothetical protein
MMSNREHFDSIDQLLEHDIIREASHRQPARFPGHEGNPQPSGRKGLNQFKGALHFVNEPISDLRIPLAIPGARVKFLPRGGLDEYRIQR